MKGLPELERLFTSLGFSDFKWADPRSFVVAEWVRQKCRFGCPEYGRAACCPPAVPSVEDCRRFFREYRLAAVFRFEKIMKNPADRHAWTRGVNRKLLELERRVFLSGREKAFLLFMDSCGLCRACSGLRETCKLPKMARPTPEAMAIDVFSTVRRLGFPIRVLSEVSQPMNRYAFLLVR